jgi:hypothetical protein
VPYNGSPNPDPSSTVIDENDDDDDKNMVTDENDDENCCCICAASPMYKPTLISSCRHSFCFGCISREVDARRQCPLDRQAVTRDMLQAVLLGDSGQGGA